MQVVSQLATIYVDSPVSLFTPQNHESLVNMSFGQFVTNEEVILPACGWETLPTSVQVMLPAHFWVNTCFQVNAALKGVNKSATPTWVNTCVQVNDSFPCLLLLHSPLPWAS